MVGDLVMPISALNELSKAWCGSHSSLRFVDLFRHSVLYSLHPSSVGIAVDRYWAVTNVDYIRVRTGKRIGLMIVAVWVISLAISLPARFTLTDELRRTQIANGTCAINEDTTARKRIRKKAFKGQNKAIQLVQNQQRQESNLGTPQADDLPEAEQGPSSSSRPLLSLNLLAKQNCKS
uniref:G_PROTEIN_RECEP_F1_2 domain-containing protein n=1 Tax=Macrostomum lignano TaxID=282301 RepID=A0A1I8FTU1_9PLAT